MVTIWILTISLFVVITFFYWKLTRGYVERVSGKKMSKQWGTRTYYWHTALLVSGGITVMIVYLLKWAKVLIF